MKNKEIEELLNILKKEDDYWSKTKHDYPFPDYYSLNREDLHLLLSYIEQLENLCNKYEQEHKTTFKIWKEDIKKLKQLENNRDKAIEYIKEKTTDDEGNDLGYSDNIDYEILLNILKGDSDE